MLGIDEAEKDIKKQRGELVLSPINSDNIIISEDTWNKSVAIRNKRTDQKDPHKFLTPFILKDKLICAKCNRIMKPKNPGKNKSNVYKCATNKNEREVCNCIIPSKLVEEFFIYKIKDIFHFKNTDYIYNFYLEKQEAKDSQINTIITELNKRIIDTEDFLKKLEENILNETDEIIKSAFKKQYSIKSHLLKTDKESLTFFKKKLQYKKINKNDFFKKIEMFLPSLFDPSKLGSEYTNSEIRMQQRTFINDFIEKITVDYDKKNKEIKKMEIFFIGSDLI